MLIVWLLWWEIAGLAPEQCGVVFSSLREVAGKTKNTTHIGHFGQKLKRYWVSEKRKKETEALSPGNCRMFRKKREWKVQARSVTGGDGGRKFVVLTADEAKKKGNVSPPFRPLLC